MKIADFRIVSFIKVRIVFFDNEYRTPAANSRTDNFAVRLVEDSIRASITFFRLNLAANFDTNSIANRSPAGRAPQFPRWNCKLLATSIGERHSEPNGEPQDEPNGVPLCDRFSVKSYLMTRDFLVEQAGNKLFSL